MSLYYLSEISVSGQHGGGLTLQRVLREDLSLFQQFMIVSAFGMQYTPVSAVADRTVAVCGIEDTFLNKGRIRKRIRRYLLGRNWLTSWNARYIVRRLQKKTDLLQSHWLVVPQSELSVRVTNLLYEKYKVKYAIWQMDDHLVRYNADRRPQYSPVIEKEMKGLMKNAAFRWVISPAMAALYEQKWKVRSEVLFGPATSSNLPPHIHVDKNKPLRLVYFGAVTAWQLGPLVFLAGLLPEINAELHIYSAKDNLPDAVKKPGVYYKGSVPGSEVAALANTYDGIILPISFEKDLYHLTALNIATKMSECLASGTVTVVIGPDYAAMVDYLQPHGCALLMTDKAKAAEQLQQLRDEKKRETLLTNAARLVSSRLTPDAMYGHWRKGYEVLMNN